MREWSREPLGRVAEVRPSNVDKQSNLGEQPVRLCNYMDVYTRDYITEDIAFMEATATSAERQRFCVERGDVLITKDSETPDDIGISAVVLDDIKDLVCGYHLALLKPNRGRVDPVYLAKQLASSESARYFGRLANGSTRYGLSYGSIAATPIRLAPLPDQQRIADILSTLDDAIEQTEALIAKTQQIKAGLMHDLFTRGVLPNGQLRPPRDEAPKLYRESPLGWIPKEWEVESFGSVTPDGAPICYGIVQPGEYHHDGVPVVAIFNLNTDYSSLHRSSGVIESAYVRSRIREGDVLLSIKGSIGRADVTPPEFSGNISRDVARIRPRAGIQSLWLRYALESKPVQSLLGRISVGTTRQELSIGRLKQVQIAIPPEPEQDRIARRLASSDANACGERDSLSKLERLKRGLMHDLLTGRVRVPAPEAQGAAAHV